MDPRDKFDGGVNFLVPPGMNPKTGKYDLEKLGKGTIEITREEYKHVSTLDVERASDPSFPHHDPLLLVAAGMKFNSSFLSPEALEAAAKHEDENGVPSASKPNGILLDKIDKFGDEKDRIVDQPPVKARLKPGDTIRIGGENFPYKIRKIVKKDLVLRNAGEKGPVKLGDILAIVGRRYLVRKFTKKDIFLRPLNLKDQ